MHSQRQKTNSRNLKTVNSYNGTRVSYEHSLMKSSKDYFPSENTKAKKLNSLFQATWLLFLHTEDGIQIVSHSTVLI